MKHAPGFLALVEAVRPSVVEVSVREAVAGGRTLIDVREASEVADGLPVGAMWLARGILERDIESVVPDRSAKIALLCGGGFRSCLAAESLQRMGYTSVVSVAGGMRAWRDQGLPTTALPSV